jgi:AbrB family looped-hinge helix DNA binding protein
METVTVSSKGQIAIPKEIRDALNLSAGTKLNLDVQGQRIVLSKECSWRDLEGSINDPGLMEAFARFRKEEREREDAGI